MEIFFQKHSKAINFRLIAERISLKIFQKLKNLANFHNISPLITKKNLSTVKATAHINHYRGVNLANLTFSQRGSPKMIKKVKNFKLSKFSQDFLAITLNNFKRLAKNSFSFLSFLQIIQGMKKLNPFADCYTRNVPYIKAHALIYKFISRLPVWYDNIIY